MSKVLDTGLNSIYDADTQFAMTRAMRAISADSSLPHSLDVVTLIVEFRCGVSELLERHAEAFEGWWSFASKHCGFSVHVDNFLYLPEYGVHKVELSLYKRRFLRRSRYMSFGLLRGSYNLGSIDVRPVCALEAGRRTLPNAALYDRAPWKPGNLIGTALSRWVDSYTTKYAWKAVRRYVRMRLVAFFWWGLAMQRHCALGGEGREADKRSFDEMEGTSASAIELPPAVRRRV
jgi:hypothetical protein